MLAPSDTIFPETATYAQSSAQTHDVTNQTPPFSGVDTRAITARAHLG